MSPVTYKLRPPSQLEVLFYQELRAPLRAFVAGRSHAPSQIREVKLHVQRFKKDIFRYGYVLTQGCLMMLVEPDIVDTKLDAAHRAMLFLDMQIINRLTDGL